MERASLGYIFGTFLKIGATGFGGFMALVAVVQKQICQIDRKLSEEDLLDAISLASVLPGPVAFNVVVYVGYKLRGYLGALVAFLAILLPCFLLVLLLSWLYFSYGQTPAIRSVFDMIIPVVTGLIVTTGINMGKKQLKCWQQWAIMAASCAAAIAFKGYLTTLAIMVAGSLCGLLFFRESNVGASDSAPKQLRSTLATSAIIAAVLCAFVAVLYFVRDFSMPLQIASVFSGMSLTLFGGGYVVIPALNEMFVTNLAWLSSPEFADGIAIGQVTPGPIFISAAFIGYKVLGVAGAVIATLSFFTPPALLMLLCSRFLDGIRQSQAIKAVFKGVRPAVIGLIFAAIPSVGKNMPLTWLPILMLAATIYLSLKYKVSPVYLIAGAGLFGFVISLI